MLVVLVLGRRLPREPGRPGFDIVASALDLVDERLHVGREAAGHEDAHVKLLRGRMLLSFIKPTLEIFEHLHALRDRLVIHGVLPFVWCVGEVLELRTKIPPAEQQPRQTLLTAVQARQASSDSCISYSG